MAEQSPKNPTPEIMYPVGNNNNPEDRTPISYKSLSRDAAALTISERTQLMTEITTSIGLERIKALQQTSKALDEWNKENPRAMSREYAESAAFKNYRAVLEPIQADVEKIMEKYQLISKSFGGRDDGPPIINYIIDTKTGKDTIPKNDPGSTETERRNRNAQMASDLIKKMRTPPQKQNDIGPVAPKATSGASIPQRTPGGPN